MVLACGPSFETRCWRTAPQDEVRGFVDILTGLILRSPAQQGVSKDVPKDKPLVQLRYGRR
jgi:hypothetical protein